MHYPPINVGYFIYLNYNTINLINIISLLCFSSISVVFIADEPIDVWFLVCLHVFFFLFFSASYGHLLAAEVNASYHRPCGNVFADCRSCQDSPHHYRWSRYNLHHHPPILLVFVLRWPFRLHAFFSTLYDGFGTKPLILRKRQSRKNDMENMNNDSFYIKIDLILYWWFTKKFV